MIVSTVNQYHGQWHRKHGPAGLTLAQDKKIIARKGCGTVKQFNIRNRYGFITRSNTREVVFLCQTAIKNNHLRKYLHSVEDGILWSLMLLKETGCCYGLAMRCPLKTHVRNNAKKFKGEIIIL